MAATSEERIAKAFHRLGWTGVWIQAVLAILPILMLTYVLFGKVSGTRGTFGVMDYFALLGIAILIFTTFWSYRYTRIAHKLTAPEKRPSWVKVSKTLWVGLWASGLGMAVSLLLLFVEILRLLFHFMKAPQAGVPVIQTQAETRLSWVSTIDVVTLFAELCTLVGEMVIAGFSLWLLFLVMQRMNRVEKP